MKNIFKNIPDKLDNELIENLLVTKTFKIERIISRGHITPSNKWYDQETNEFVLLISGSAELEFEDNTFTKLAPGDWLVIPAHKKHRVSYTSLEQDSVWLTIHYE